MAGLRGTGAGEFRLISPLPGAPFAGWLALDDARREVLARLVAAEDECWCPDANGERLPADALFDRSPWCCPGPADPIELLCRFLDLRDGSIRFQAPETYPGDHYRWMRAGGSDQDD